ncbi:transposase zinc-binding domain-containing protein [Sorangium sp. So ce1078]|uniref:transposase zinc-binding domain-containing protein n=1 Tax=Sorangium sp. So ce1078 TaxID=3133329 RepID=UPI003F5EBEF0
MVAVGSGWSRFRQTRPLPPGSLRLTFHFSLEALDSLWSEFQFSRKAPGTFSPGSVGHTERTYAAPLSRDVVDTFEHYLDCGDLAGGFLRCHCGDCGHDVLVAFACKARAPIVSRC